MLSVSTTNATAPGSSPSPDVQLIHNAHLPHHIPSLIQECIKRGVMKRDIPGTLRLQYNIQISIRTMRRIMRRFIGISAIRSSDISLGDKEETLLRMITDDPSGRMGARQLKQMLGHTKAIHVTQDSITAFLQAVDSAASAVIASGVPEDNSEMTVTSEVCEDESNFEHDPSRFCVDTVNHIFTDRDFSSYRSNVNDLDLQMAYCTAQALAGRINTDQKSAKPEDHSRVLSVTSQNPSNRLGSRRIKNLETRGMNRPRRHLLLNFLRRVTRRATAPTTRSKSKTYHRVS